MGGRRNKDRWGKTSRRRRREGGGEELDGWMEGKEASQTGSDTGRFAIYIFYVL